MPLRIHKSQAATEDLRQLVKYLNDHSPELAERFLDAAEASFALLASNPELGTRHETSRREFAGLRVWSMREFPRHLIFYRQMGADLQIARVIHGVRDLESQGLRD